MKTMKRIVCLLLTVAMLAGLPVMASAASYDHVHDYASKETHNATCTEQGYELYKCKLCDASYKTNYTPSLHQRDDAGEMRYSDSNKNWEYVCKSCNKVIFTVRDNSCSTSTVTTEISKVEYDKNGSMKTTIGTNVKYQNTKGDLISEKLFATGTVASIDTKKVYKNGMSSHNTVLYSDAECGTAVSAGNADAAKALIEKLLLKDKMGVYFEDVLSATAAVDGDYVTLVVKVRDMSDMHLSAKPDTTSVTVTETDTKGNVKTTVNGTASYTCDGVKIDAKYFACGDITNTVHNVKEEKAFIGTKAAHADKDMTVEAVVVGASGVADCTSGGKAYTVSTCTACNMKFYNAGTAVSGADKCIFPENGNYEADKTYTVAVDATTSKEGYAYRKCATCGKEETMVIPRQGATYPAYTTNEIVAVYKEANAGDAQTVSGLKIGNLPKGAAVLVMETKNGFSRILAKGDAWVLTSKLTKVNEADVKVNCKHDGKITEFYVANATCQFAKMKTSRCETCDKYYVFTTSDTANAHTDKGGHAWQNIEPATFKIENDTAWTITKKPSETENGEMERVCAACGYKEAATGADTTDAKYAYKNVKILKATGTVNTKAYINVSVAEIFDSFGSDKKLVYYAPQGTNVTVTGYAIDKTWAHVVAGSNKGYVPTSSLKLDASSGMSASYDGAVAYAIVADGAQMKVRLSYSETSSVLSAIASGNAFVIFETKEVSGSIWGRIESKNADKWVKLGDAKAGKLDTDKLNGLKSYAPLLATYSVSSPVASLTDAIAQGHVTSSINLNIRESASVSAKLMGGFAKDTKIFIYEVKTVNGVQWAKVQGMKASNGTITWKEITKADLEDTTKSLVSGWVCMTYVALDTEIGAPSGPASTASTGTVATGGIALNVRSKADVYSDKVGALPNGTKVTIYETANASNNVAWGRISQNSLDGWVCLQYVTMDAPASGTASGTAAAKLNAAVANCATAVNVRSKADISGTQVAKIPVGTRIAITKTENGWGYVDGKGWVYLQYVAFDTGALDALNKPVPAPGIETSISTYTNVSVPALVEKECKVYASPNDTSAVLMTIHAQDSIQVVDRAIVSGKLWYKISEGTVSGWIKSYVTSTYLFFQRDETLISMQAITGTITSTANVYAEPSVDSNVRTVLGAGSKFSVEAGNRHHATEGVYAWAEISTGGWIQLHKTSLDKSYNASFLPSYSELPAITGSIISAAGAPLYKEHALTSSKLITLAKDTTVTVLDWYHDNPGRTWGKVTQGQYTGWIVLSDVDESIVNVEQNSVSGTVSVDALNLYNTCGQTTDVQLVLRSGDKVTVTERRLVNNAVWGRMVADKDTSKRQLWANLAGITLEGQKTGTSENPAPVVTPVVTTPTSVTIGVVVGNFDTVNVRQQPHVSSPLVATVKKGSQVKVSETTMSDGAHWGKIENGWIAMQYVSLQASTVATNPTTNITTGTTIMTSVPSGAVAVGFTSIDNLAVRSAAGVAMPQVGTMKMGTGVVIYETTYNSGLYWGRTDEGWICMSYVVNTAVGTAGTGTAGTIARCNYTVNVRATAGTNSAITAKIMVSSPVQILETTTYGGELWGRTNLGWVAMQYVA